MSVAAVSPNASTSSKLADRIAALGEATPDELEELESWLDDEGFATPGELARWVTSHGDQPRWLRGPHLDALDDLFARVADEGGVRAVAQAPPQHGKTGECSQWGPLWYLRRHPDHRVVVASYAAEYAQKHGRWVRNMIEAGADPENEAVPDLGLRLRRDSQAANRWDLQSMNGRTARGGMLTVGRGGPLTGNAAHLIILDDPFKNMEEADSELLRERVDDWFRTAVLTRLRPNGSVIIMHTRWHEDDLIGRLLDREPATWELLDFPAIAGDPDQLGREPGEPLWPVVYDAEFLASQRAGLGSRAFGAMYQQRPTPLEGVLFHRAAIDANRILPGTEPRMLSVREYVDPAFSDSPDADETGRIVMGLGIDRKAYVLADLSARAAYDMLPIGSTQASHGTTYVKVEQNLLGKRVRDTVAGIVPRGVNVGDIKATGTKAARAEAASAMVDGGQVKFVGSFDELEDQMLRWKPTDRDSPDRMDAFVHGVRDLLLDQGKPRRAVLGSARRLVIPTGLDATVGARR